MSLLRCIATREQQYFQHQHDRDQSSLRQPVRLARPTNVEWRPGQYRARAGNQRKDTTTTATIDGYGVTGYNIGVTILQQVTKLIWAYLVRCRQIKRSGSCPARVLPPNGTGVWSTN